MTDPAGPAGAQEPTIYVAPECVYSSGRDAVELAANTGLVLDPWQRLILCDALGERQDGTWSAFEAAVIVARQNGKGAVLEARVLAGLFLLNERLILYSAHEFKSAVEMFRRIEQLISGDTELKKRVRRVDRTRGEEGIELVTGQRLRFVARSTGSGRGFTGDLNIWDECQHLPDTAVDALMPTMSARPNPQLWYAGSAPDQDIAPCEQITRVRRRALSNSPGRLAYFEWSAELCDERCSPTCTAHDRPNDPATWAKTNPGLGIRISPEHIATEYESMSVKGFARERLSVGNWATDGGGWGVIPEDAWTALRARTAADQGDLRPVAFAVDVTPERSHAAIGVAGRAGGRLWVEVAEHRRGTGWVVPRLVELVAKWRPCAVVVTRNGPAGSLIPEIETAGVEVVKPSAADEAQAAGALFDAVMPAEGEPTLRHVGQPALDAAVRAAARSDLGDGAWRWSRRSSLVDISPLVAVTLAAWGHATHAHLHSTYDVLESVW